MMDALFYLALSALPLVVLAFVNLPYTGFALKEKEPEFYTAHKMASRRKAIS